MTHSTYAQVKVYEGTEVIPTYQKGEDEKSPIFYTDHGVQGAEGKVYPYPSQTKLGDVLGEVFMMAPLRSIRIWTLVVPWI